MIKFACPSCKKTYQVKPELGGKRVKCAGCSTIILVPTNSNANAPLNAMTQTSGFDALKDSATAKAGALTRAVTTDKRWKLEDELMCQVFGFTLFGYVFGYGRTICFMNVSEIQQLAAKQLSGLGIGPKYAEGLMATAYEEFRIENNTSLYNSLIGVGHSHFAAEDTSELVNSIFQNTEIIRAST